MQLHCCPFVHTGGPQPIIVSSWVTHNQVCIWEEKIQPVTTRSQYLSPGVCVCVFVCLLERQIKRPNRQCWIQLAIIWCSGPKAGVEMTLAVLVRSSQFMKILKPSSSSIRNSKVKTYHIRTLLYLPKCLRFVIRHDLQK